MKQASSAGQELEATESQAEHPPKLEFSTVKEADESLEAYISAISGAVIGVLATLLILYILNGGTLRFTNSSQIEALEASLTRVDENVGAVNQNVDLVAQRLAALEGENGAISQMQASLANLDASLSDLDATLADQGMHLEELDQAVATLDVTRQQFDTFTAALVKALADMGKIPADEAAPAEPAPESAAPAEAVAVEEPAAESAAPAEAVAVEEPAAESAAPAEAVAVEEPAAESAAPAEAVAVEEPAAESAAPAEAVAVEEPAAEAAPAEAAALEEPAAEAAPAEAAPAEAAPAEETAAETPAESLGVTLAAAVVASGDVAADAVRAVLFVDGNGNGSLDEGETTLAGAAVTLSPAEGEALTLETDETGAALFEGLAAGEYTVAVESVPELELAGENAIPVNVEAESATGYTVFFAVPAGE
ncbi:MAG: hypothetical protein D6790_12395 [Caldilineae bacterium]|nr:MAG: hypothetical protein D6790_12395 [Caldilineae bacterium]